MSEPTRGRELDERLLRAIQGRSASSAVKASRAGGRLSAKDASGTPAIIGAVWEDEIGVARALIKQAAALGDFKALKAKDAKGRSLLEACLMQKASSLCVLLAQEEFKTDLGSPLANGDTALLHAIKHGLDEVRDAFIHASKRMGPQSKREILDGLDSHGENALLLCIRKADAKAVHGLLSAGADAGARSASGLGALGAALECGRADIAHKLIKFAKARGELGWLDSCDAHGEPAIMLALRKRQPELASAMIDAGAHADVRDAQGQSLEGLCSELGQAKLGRKVKAALHQGGIQTAQPALPELAKTMADRRAAAACAVFAKGAPFRPRGTP